MAAKPRLTSGDFMMAGQVYDVDPVVLRAVAKVESGGGGFLPDGRPKILFEGHVFWQRLKLKGIDPAELVRDHPDWSDVLYEEWTTEHYSGNVTGRESVDEVPGFDEWDRLRRAQWIDPETGDHSALESCSWGKFQVLGLHWRNLGYIGVHEFVAQMFESEAKHLDAFMRYCRAYALLDAMRDEDWATFARGYNGKGYKKNRYDAKLAHWVARFREGST